MHLLAILFVFLLSPGLSHAIKRAQLVKDFSFENGTNNIYWTQRNGFKMNADAGIGTTSNPAPYQGKYCAFANIYPDNNLNSQIYQVGQNITFPKGGNSTLSFYYNIPYPINKTQNTHSWVNVLLGSVGLVNKIIKICFDIQFTGNLATNGWTFKTLDVSSFNNDQVYYLRNELKLVKDFLNVTVKAAMALDRVRIGKCSHDSI